MEPSRAVKVEVVVEEGGTTAAIVVMVTKLLMLWLGPSVVGGPSKDMAGSLANYLKLLRNNGAGRTFGDEDRGQNGGKWADGLIYSSFSLFLPPNHDVRILAVATSLPISTIVSSRSSIGIGRGVSVLGNNRNFIAPSTSTAAPTHRSHDVLLLAPSPSVPT